MFLILLSYRSRIFIYLADLRSKNASHLVSGGKALDKIQWLMQFQSDCCCLVESLCASVKEVAGLQENVTNCATSAKWILPLLLPLLPGGIKASHYCWQTFRFFIFFFAYSDFRKNWGVRKPEREKGNPERGVRKQRPALSFLLNIKKKKKKRRAEEKPSDHYVAACRCIQLVVVGKALAWDQGFQ